MVHTGLSLAAIVRLVDIPGVAMVSGIFPMPSVCGEVCVVIYPCRMSTEKRPVELKLHQLLAILPSVAPRIYLPELRLPAFMLHLFKMFLKWEEFM